MRPLGVCCAHACCIGDARVTAELARPATTAPLDGAPGDLARIVIAWAGFGELPALARLQQREFANHAGYGLLTLTTLWAAPRVMLLVARAGQAPAGMIIADEKLGITPHGRILNICVALEYRRCGLGRELMLTAEALLPMRRMILMVDQQNAPAISLYESLGYHNVGLRPNYYGRGRHALVMQKG